MIGGSCNTNPIRRNLLRGYTGHQWMYYYLKFLIKRFRPKGEQRLGQLTVKFEQLTMTVEETISAFLDQIRDCIAEIRACDPSQVHTEVHSNGKFVNQRERDWTNKTLARDKHVRRCFVCGSEDHFIRNCPKNPNLKKLKFEKRQRKDKEKTRREILLFKKKKATTIT